MSVFFTPKMFSAGSKKAQCFFEKAKPLFIVQEVFSVLKPTWGTIQNEEFLLNVPNNFLILKYIHTFLKNIKKSYKRGVFLRKKPY